MPLCIASTPKYRDKTKLGPGTFVNCFVQLAGAGGRGAELVARVLRAVFGASSRDVATYSGSGKPGAVRADEPQHR